MSTPSYYDRLYCENCKLIYGKGSIGIILKCTKCGRPLILKSFNPYPKVIGGVIILILAISSFFINEIPIIWIGGLFLGVSMISNSLSQWNKIKKLDESKYYYMEEGKQILNEESSKEKQYKGGFFTNLFRWNMGTEEVKYQVDNYNKLGFFRSAKGVAITLMIISAICDLFIPNGWVDSIIILVLALFVYKGSRIALIITMIYWTFSKVFLIVSAFSSVEDSTVTIVWSIISWAIWMGAFWGAYQVERERKKITNITKKDNYIFCFKCGAKIPQDSKFCPKCGTKISQDSNFS